MSTSSDPQQACFGVTQGKIEEPTDQNGLSVFPLDGTSSNGQVRSVTSLPLTLYSFFLPIDADILLFETQFWYSSSTEESETCPKSMGKPREHYIQLHSQDATIHITIEPETLLITGYHAIPVQPPPPHPTINLNRINDTEDISYTDKCVIMFEFSRTLDFGHEQRSPSPETECTYNKNQQKRRASLLIYAGLCSSSSHR